MDAVDFDFQALESAPPATVAPTGTSDADAGRYACSGDVAHR